MRIGYLLNTLGIGGAERLVLALADRMAKRGHAVRIITLLDPGTHRWPTDLDVVHLGISREPVSLVRGLARAIREVRSFRPHVLHSHNFHGNLLARGIKLAFPPVRVISTLHNEYEGGRARMLSLKFTDALSDRTVAVSDAVAERALERGLMPQGKCAVIRNGIDLMQFLPAPDRRSEVRAAMRAGDDFIWLSAGRIAAAKDPGTLLRAFAQVHAEAPRTQLWIAGEPVGREFESTLRITAENLGLRHAVQWLGVRHDVPSLLDAADAFVLSSAWEGMPLALGEAMAMEKPIVATGVGGVGELVGQCGLIVPPRNPNALARAMFSILNTPPEARRFLGRAARQRITEHFNIESKADAWEALYREAAGSSE